MPKYKVIVRRKFEEIGQLTVEADDKDEAHDVALGCAIDGDGQIRWQPSGALEYFVDEVKANAND